MNVTCPECHATLEPDEIDYDRRECPMCGASLASLDLSDIEDQLSREEAIAEPSSDAEGLASPRATADSATSILEIIEQTPDRLVVHLPPNPTGSSGLGGFAVIWNGFLLVFTVIGAFAMRRAAKVELFPIAIVALFWLVGIAMLIAWVRARYTRIFLLLERDRLVVQRKLRGTTNRELILGQAPLAALEESYSINDVPVYQITVRGEGRSESFGVGLPESDKRELVTRINRFLGVDSELPSSSTDETVCPVCGSPLDRDANGELNPTCPSCRNSAEQSGRESLWAPLRAGSHEIPAGMVIDDSDPGSVEIRYPLIPASGIGRVAQLFFLGFAAFWVFVCFAIVTIGFRQGQGVPMLVIATAMSIPGIAAGMFGQALIRGRVTILLLREQVRMSWGWGPLKIRKQLPVSSITECGMIRRELRHGRPRPKILNSSPFAAFKCGGTSYPLTTTHGADYGQKVVRVIRTYLEDQTGKPLEF